MSTSAPGKSSDEKKELAAQLNQLIEQLPDDNQETKGLKSYFQLLLAVVNREDYKPYLEKIPGELKELFEKTEAD